MKSVTLDTVIELLDRSGVPVTVEQEKALRIYVETLLELNRNVNLVSRKDVSQIWRNHIVHSLAPLLLNLLPQEAAYIDIGTGGGLPGLPLAILMPASSFALIDSITKKIRAVDDMLLRCGVGNARSMTGRIEQRDELRSSADIILARAVTRLSDLVRWSWPLLRPHGPRRLIAWKGGDIDEEIAGARAHARVSDIIVHQISIPGLSYFTDEDKKLVEVRFT
jgi:16S rRNA (guanine527-N7)-methyltransferase